MFSAVRNLFKNFLILLVRGYQYLISPLLGPRCRFYPSCSSYMIEAIQIHGPIKGVWMGCKRLLRCHPGSEGGMDPVPGSELACQCEKQAAEEKN